MTHEKRTTAAHRVTLTAGDIRRAVRQVFGIDVHPEAKVYVMVPGGGDWSGMDLDVREHSECGVSDSEVFLEWEAK